MNNVDSYNLHTIHLQESTLDEEDSFYFLHHYNLNKKLNYIYRYPDIDLNTIYILSSNFAFFYGRIYEKGTNNFFQTNTPLNVFRYLMLEDGSWSNFYTLKKKPGYVVEGMYWSNGMMYQVREDKKSDFEIYEIILSIDSLTKTMHNFPDLEYK